MRWFIGPFRARRLGPGLASLIVVLNVALIGPMSLAAGQQESDPKTVPEFLDRGLTLYDQKDFDGAVAAFTEAIRLDPNSASALAYRAQAWRAKHYRDREIADLDQAIRLDPKNPSYRLSRAGSWSSQGRHEQAMVDYDDAIRLEPNNPSLYVARGDEWRRHLKLDLAIGDYDRAIHLEPSYIHAYIRRALITKQRRAFAQAVAELSAIIRAAPENAEAHQTLARILATCTEDGVRDGNRAVQEATRACELTRWSDPDAVDTLAAAYAEAGDFQSAVQWQTKAIALTGINPTASVKRAPRSRGRRGLVLTDRVGFEDRLAFYKRKKPCRE